MVKNKAVKTAGASKVRSPQDLHVLAVDMAPVAMEPRVMLDANLEWDLNGTTAITSVMSAIAQIFYDSFDDVADFLREFETSASQAFDVVGSIIDTTKSTGVGDVTAVSEAVQRIKDAIDTVKDGSISRLTNLLGGSFGLQVAAGMNSYLDAEATTAGYMAALTAEQIDELFTIANLRDGTVGADVDGFLASADLGGVNTSDARVEFDRIVSSVLGLGGAGGNDFGVILEDVQIDGRDVITFTATAGNSVEVQINLPDVEVVADFTQMLATALPGSALPFDFELLGSSMQFMSFELSTDTNFTGDVLDDLALHIDTFNFAPLLQVGGDVTLPAGADLSLGFLKLGVTEAETAQLRLDILPGSGMDLGARISFDTTPVIDFFATDASIAVQALIKDLDASIFTAVTTDARYSLLEVDFDGALDFSSVSQAFVAGVTLSSVLDSSGPQGRIQEFIKAVDFDFAFELSDSTLPSALRDTLEETLFTLASLGAAEISQFIEGIGQTIANALLDKAFDVDLPLTDLRLATVLADMASVFSRLVDTFSISSTALGFVNPSAADGTNTQGDVVADTAFSQQVDAQRGAALTLGQLANLATYSSLSLKVLDGSGNTTNVEIDLTGSDAVDGTKTLKERMQSLVDLLDDALSAQGIAVALAGNLGLRVTSTQVPGTGGNPATYNTFAVVGARKVGTGTVDTDFDLENLGFDFGNLTDQAETFGEDTTEKVLRFAIATTDLDIGTLDLSQLAGVKNLRFGISLDGVDEFVDVSSNTGWSSVAEVAADFSAALSAKGVGLGVGLNAAGDGLSFSLAADELRSVVINQDSAQLLRALDIDGLIEWVNTELNGAFPGAKLELTEAGELIFSMPDVTQVVEITAEPASTENASTTNPKTDGLFLNTDGIDLGVLQGLDISGALAAQLNATLSTAVGIDLLGFGSDLTASGGANALAASQSFTGKLGDAVMDNVFFNNLSLAGEIDGTVSAISGSADLGILKVTIGGSDPALNFAHVNAQFEANILGTNAEDGFNEQLTFANLRSAVVDTIEMVNGERQRIKAAGLTSLLGRFEVLGGIVVDGEGRGLNASGEVAQTAADVTVVDDAFLYAGSDDIAQLLINIGDISVDVAGIPGINADLVDGVGVTIIDLADIVETYDVALISNDPGAEDAIKSLSNLENGDILDSMVAIANVLVVVGETLSDKMPFLNTDIPLLNISILDQINFAADFLDALQELRNDPQSGLDTVEAQLEAVFGADTVTLEWVPSENTILFDLNFEFLEEYQKNIPFQLDLAELLGSQLERLVGPALAGVVSGLVDTSGDGELVFDPLLSLNFSFGIDLTPTLATPVNIVSSTAALADLATVSSVNLRPGGGEDLRIIWTDTATDTSKQVEVDLEGLETLAEVVAAVQAKVVSEFGSSVSFAFDNTTGQITLSDANNEIIIDTDVTALFGAATAEAVEADGLYSITLDSGFNDFAGALDFTINIGDEAIAISIDADATRTTAVAFATAFNAALADASVLRTEQSFPNCGAFGKDCSVPIDAG